jgi:predicted permease
MDMSMLEGFLQDLRFGARALAKNPGVTTVAALSLALGIGANTAIFSLINAVLLKTLPVSKPQELVLLTDPTAFGVSIGSQGPERSTLSYGEFEHIRDRQEVFAGMYAAESSVQRTTATVDGLPAEIHPRLVTGTYFDVLGVAPVLGHAFSAADDRAPHSAPYAVISYAYWDKRFARSPDVLGKVIKVGKASLTIVGVTPATFFGEAVGQNTDVWIPMMMEPDVKPGRDWLHDDESQVMRVMWLEVMGRLKPGVSFNQAQANIAVVFQQILKAYQVSGLTAEQRKNQLEQKLKLRPGAKGTNALSDDFGRPLLVLMTVVGLVLLIACANIANLLLARAAGRQKEIAVRLAMGASRLRLGMQLLTESLLLSCVGAVVGLLCSMWGSRVLLRLVSNGPDPVAIDPKIDLGVLGFTAALAIVTGILFGLAPAFRAARVEVASTLKENSRGVLGGGGRISLGKALVVTQIAVSLLLLIGSGLFIRTLRNLQNVQLGYGRDNLALISIDATTAGYKGASAADLYARLADQVRAIPGVQSVTYSQNGLFSGGEAGTQLYIESYTPVPGKQAGARFDAVGPGYFSALGIPLLRGREITRQDTGASTPVCVINQAMAKEYFVDRDPLGKHIKDLFPGSTAQFEIVGVAQDARDHSLRGQIPSRFYVPVAQGLPEVPGFVVYEIRSATAIGGVATAARKKIQSADQALEVENPITMEETIRRQLLQERIIAQLSTFFGGLALLLASIGLYGVLSYAVARRTNEIGIRMAIGAQQGSVVWMILRETLILIAIGGVIGIGASLALENLVASQMFGVTAADPLTMMMAGGTLTVIAMIAACFPAMRAAKVDPLVALRVE